MTRGKPAENTWRFWLKILRITHRTHVVRQVDGTLMLREGVKRAFDHGRVEGIPQKVVNSKVNTKIEKTEHQYRMTKRVHPN